MMIILEGPDNSGKSTLAKQICSELEINLTHSGGPPKDDHREIYDRTERLIDTVGDVVFDRFPYFSEYVYSSVLKNRPVFDQSSFTDDLKDVDPLVIYCRPPLAQLLQLDDQDTSNSSPEHVALVRQNALALIHKYDEVMLDWGYFLYYDHTAGGEQFRSLLMRHIRSLITNEELMERLHG